MSVMDYKVVETELGPLLSHSRVSVYDVLEARRQNQDLYRICVNYNLTPVQVQIALEYIEQNYERLTAELDDLLIIKAEREQLYRAQAAKIRAKIAQKPMTSKRVKFYALLEKNRRARGDL